MELNALALAKPMVIFRLALLCKATRHLTAEMHQMVREYLIIRLGVISPMIDELMWRCIRERGPFGMTLKGSVPPEHRTIGPITVRHITYEKPANWGDEEIVVHVRLSEWSETGLTYSYTLPWMMHIAEYNVTALLDETRKQFDIRDEGYQREIEAPWTHREWMNFCQLWLFGPSMPAPLT